MPYQQYLGTRRRIGQGKSGAMPPNARKCHIHQQAGCTTCKQLRRTAHAGYELGHNATDSPPRSPQLQLYQAHELPPAHVARQSKGGYTIAVGDHHKVCAPTPPEQKALCANTNGAPAQKITPSPAPTTHTGLIESPPHPPPTPLAPKQRRHSPQSYRRDYVVSALALPCPIRQN